MMLQEVDYCCNIIRTMFNKPLNMTAADEWHFKQAKECHIYGKKYLAEHRCVRHHCHVTGKYCGPAHEADNLNFQLTDKIPAIFHKLHSYDSHSIMQQIGDIVKKNTSKHEKVKECQLSTQTPFSMTLRNTWYSCWVIIWSSLIPSSS